MKVKYVIIVVIDGKTTQFEYPVEDKAQAICDFKNIRLRADRIRLFSIDSEDEEIWYDLSNKY